MSEQAVAEERTVALEIAGIRFDVDLDDVRAPLAVKAFRKMIPLRGTIVHSMWSGPICLMGRLNLDDAPLENAAAFLTLGDIAYHPTHHEIGITYGTTQWREPVGSVYVTRLGRVNGDLSLLADFGGKLQRTGAQELFFR